MEAEGLARQVKVEGMAEPSWIDGQLLPRLAEVRAGRGQPALTTLLSPFDNLIWHRGRTLALFGFDYRLESYTPAHRRRYGYYTLPILDRGRLIGRVDPVYDRRARRLTIRSVHLEAAVPIGDGLIANLAAALRDLLAFLGGDSVVIATSGPPQLTPALAVAVDSTES